MPRPVKDSKLDSRTARARLAPRGKPYWRELDPGLHLGYRRGKAGRWVARRYLGGQSYEVETIGTADDRADADGVVVLDWPQAQVAARAWALRRAAPAPLTVAAAIADYAVDLRARKGARAANDALGRMGKHVPKELGERRVADLTAAELTAWRNGLVNAAGDDDEVRRSRDTANRLLSIIKAALNLAFNTGGVADDRAWRRLKKFKGVGEARQVILGEDELQRLVDACGPDLRELVAVGAMTGCRLGELTGAMVREFDADAGTLQVRGKTGSRDIHLPPAAVVLLRKAASGKRPHDHLLTRDGAPWGGAYGRPFAAAVARAGLDPDTVFYSLRHSYISRALKAGVPVKGVADHAGTSIMMLQRFYAKHIPGDQQRYAAMAAPSLSVERALGNVLAISKVVR
jgi:integrase